MGQQDQGNTSLGIKANIAALLAYAVGWVTGLVFFLLEKENKFVRFHALQSLIVFGVLTVVPIVLMVIPVLGWILLPFVYLAELALWIVLMIKAYQGEKFKIPYAGDFAEKTA